MASRYGLSRHLKCQSQAFIAHAVGTLKRCVIEPGQHWRAFFSLPVWQMQNLFLELHKLAPPMEPWIFFSVFPVNIHRVNQRNKTSRAASFEPRLVPRSKSRNVRVLEYGFQGVKGDWKGLANPHGLYCQSLMYSLTIKSILNKVQPINGFTYETVHFQRWHPLLRSKRPRFHGSVPEPSAAGVASTVRPMTI